MKFLICIAGAFLFYFIALELLSMTALDLRFGDNVNCYSDDCIDNETNYK